MALSVSAATLLSYALVKKPRTKRWLDVAVMLPFGASAVTLGLGFIITFNQASTRCALFPAFDTHCTQLDSHALCGSNRSACFGFDP